MPKLSSNKESSAAATQGLIQVDPPVDYLRYIPHDFRRRAVRHFYPDYYWRALSYRGKARDDGYGLLPAEQRHCIYVHVPKCAGISVTNSLFGNLGGGHLTIRDYQIIYSAASYADFFKFTFVRHPLDRLLSAYLFLSTGGIDDKEAALAKELLSGIESFEAFVFALAEDASLQKWIHFRPQCDFLTDYRGNIAVDFIGRFESLHEDFNKVCDLLGIKASLPKLNTTKRKENWETFYSGRMKEAAELVYWRDFEQLNYARSI